MTSLPNWLILITLTAGSLLADDSLYSRHMQAPGAALMESCPPGSENARNLVERFLTAPDLADRRSETGTTGLSVNQISLLTDPQDTATCQTLQANYGSWSGEFRNIVFYKAGNFYFVAAPLEQSSSSEYVVAGPDFIVVLDDNFEELGTYGS